MTSSRPYLVRALYEWIVDNQCTPHLLVNAGYPGVVVPQDYVRDGQIVLNVAPQAVRDLQLGNAVVTFSGRFTGVSQDLQVPAGAIMAIYARENGQGMVFETEPLPEPEPQPPAAPDTESRPAGRPGLRVVK